MWHAVGWFLIGSSTGIAFAFACFSELVSMYRRREERWRQAYLGVKTQLLARPYLPDEMTKVGAMVSRSDN